MSRTSHTLTCSGWLSMPLGRFPALGLGGIDLMTPDLGTADQAVVLEVNVEANIRVHLCPAYGKPREVAGAIIDEMIATAAR